MKLNPVILSGGSGTRLWPLSREHYPKQLLCLLGEQTLLQQTVSRLDGAGNVAAPLLVCNEEHRFLIAEQLRQMGKAPADIILEPVGRNTAPALTLAALALLKHSSNDALMLVMPADHVIQNTAKFHDAVKEGAALAEKGRLVTFGIVPGGPETGYGYIKRGKGNEVEAFVEKPDARTAAQYVASSEYLWNSGMFLMLASAWLEELNRFHPAMLETCKAAYEGGKRDADFYRVDRQAFGSCQSNSIDYAVMEETDRAAVVALDAGWSDIGAWSSLWEASARDAQGNVLQGDVYAHATQNTLLISQHRFLAAVGLDDIIVVETPDAVLVAHKNHAQDVKEVVSRLKSDKRSEYQTHRRVYRPWGTYEGVDAGARFQVKRLVVNPGASLSLQMHHHRAEHWIVVKGTARVTRGDEVFMLTENQSTYIPLGTTHRLENPGNIPLEIIEVQSGSYLGEDDIVRFEDKYNRTK
ncbi:MAG: mannose-1-phosphate guanylyltransferase/mannose-6-phosphate isomerase [Pseudomonadota bacterium]